MPSIFVILFRPVGYSSSSFNRPYGDLGPLIDSSIVQGKINTYRGPPLHCIYYMKVTRVLCFYGTPKNAPVLPHKATSYPAQSSSHLHNFWRWGRPQFKVTLSFIGGTAVAQWLRCCATNRKVAGSIPAGVSGFFIDIKSFRSHYDPGVYSASNRNEYQEYFLGVKAAGAEGWQPTTILCHCHEIWEP